MKRLVVFLVLLASVLSIKAAEMYVVISTDGSTVTFYYDDEKYSKEGIVCGIEDGTWCEKLKESIQLPREIYEDDPNMIHAYNITSAVFDSSFKNARPTSTSCWFLGFESLCSIENIEYLNTSEVKDMSSMFSSCQNLKSINLSSFDTRKVTNMSCMFDGCRSLENPDVSGFDTRNVKDMSYMFSRSDILNLDLSNFDTRSVTDMSYMFYLSSSLTRLDLSGFDTRNVTNMEFMFDGCYSLTSLDLSNFDTHNVTNMAGMFGSCQSLTSLDLSSLDTDNVTDMDYMFCECSNLTRLDLSSFDTRKVITMTDMFKECSNLMSIDLSSFDTGNVTNMAGMFYKCNRLTNLDLSNFDTSNVTDLSCMFFECSQLKKLDLSNFDTRKVTDIGWMFYSCRKLISVDLSSFDTSKVTDMGELFEDCSSLTSLDLSSFNTSKVKKMSYMFYNCSSLTSLDISGFDMSSVNDYRRMCKGIGSEENPCNLYITAGFNFPEEVTIFGDYIEWLEGCFRLADKLSVEPVTVLKGSPSTMAIELKNPSSKKYIGYQFKIVLPEGVSICKKDNGQYSYTQGNRYGNTQMMMNIREQNDGSYMVLCFSLSNTPISGHEGAILSLDITSDGSLDDGSYEGAIRGIKFSTTEDADALLPDATFKVNVSKYELGDVNNDGSVSISDITLAVNYILGKASDKFHASHGDMNHDGEINISDLSEMVEIILNSGNNAPVNIGVTGGLRMESAGSECSLYLPDAGLYKGCQFLVRVPSGCRLSDVSVGAGRESGHRVMYRQTGTGLYKVLVFSADGDEFEDVPSALLRLTVDGQNGGAVELSDIRFTDTDFTEHGFAAVSSEVTGIGAVAKGVSESTWYSLDGQKTAQPTKGVFVRDGRKIVVK